MTWTNKCLFCGHLFKIGFTRTEAWKKNVDIYKRTLKKNAQQASLLLITRHLMIFDMFSVNISWDIGWHHFRHDAKRCKNFTSGHWTLQELREIKLDFEKSQAEMQVRRCCSNLTVQTWFLVPVKSNRITQAQIFFWWRFEIWLPLQSEGCNWLQV